MRKKATPLLSVMMMQMEPVTIRVRPSRAKMAAARLKSGERDNWTETSRESMTSASVDLHSCFFKNYL